MSGSTVGTFITVMTIGTLCLLIVHLMDDSLVGRNSYRLVSSRDLDIVHKLVGAYEEHNKKDVDIKDVEIKNEEIKKTPYMDALPIQDVRKHLIEGAKISIAQSTVNIKGAYEENNKKDVEIKDVEIKDVEIKWTPYMDALPIEEITKQPIEGAKVSIARSTVNIKDPKKFYNIGDEIKVAVNVQYTPNEFFSHGGDNIRVRMKESDKGAYSSGYVIDHRNGSYTAVLKALWEGNPKIVVQLKYTRYEIAYLYNIRMQFLTVRNISGKYIYGNSTAHTRCYPLRTKLNTQYGVCDVTSQNGGAPWFCERPKNHVYTCGHLKYMIKDVYDEKGLITDVFPTLWSENDITLGSALSVTIKDTSKGVKLKKPLCNEYNVSSLWTLQSPIGHFYKKKWQPYHCSPRWETVVKSACVRNKYFVLYGDSTLMQWYDNLRSRFNLTGQPTENAITREIYSKNKLLNVAVHYVRHNHPGNVMPDRIAVPNVTRGNIDSSPLESFVEMIDKSTVPVFIVHIYFHYTYYIQVIYRYRIKLLRDSIKRILSRRPDAKILIKGPHLVTFKTLGTCDYFAYVYRLLLLEELAEVRDKVIYLDHVDMSHAIGVTAVHPNGVVVREMVDQMLAYVCD